MGSGVKSSLGPLNFEFAVGDMSKPLDLKILAWISIISIIAGVCGVVVGGMGMFGLMFSQQAAYAAKEAGISMFRPFYTAAIAVFLVIFGNFIC